MTDDCETKSELAIWLDELSEYYASLTINDVSNDNSPPPTDPLIVAYENEIEAVKRAIREKFHNESFLFMEKIVKTEKNGKISNEWNLECDIESWKCNSKWWDICISNFPLGQGLNWMCWDHENNPYSLYYNDHFQ
jgi:hypothetical protein